MPKRIESQDGNIIVNPVTGAINFYHNDVLIGQTDTQGNGALYIDKGAGMKEVQVVGEGLPISTSEYSALRANDSGGWLECTSNSVRLYDNVGGGGGQVWLETASINSPPQAAFLALPPSAGSQQMLLASYVDANRHFTLFVDYTPSSNNEFAAFKIYNNTEGDVGYQIQITALGEVYLSDDTARIYSGSLFLNEQASAQIAQDAKGQVWVKSTNPSELWFTDDAGTDFIVAGSTAGVGTVTSSSSPLNNEVAVFTNGTDIEGDSKFTWDGSTLELQNRVSIIAAQTEAEYNNSPTTEGTFTAGTGYAVSEVITMSDGSTITVDAVSTGNVTEFTVTTGTVTPFKLGNTLTAVSSTASGNDDFTLTPNVDNITVDTSTQLLLPRESGAATPTLAFGDGDTGMYESTDDALWLATTGVDRVAFSTEMYVLSPVKIQERGSANTDTGAYGQVWVKNDVPNTLWFTNDVGTDKQISPTGTISDIQYAAPTSAFTLTDASGVQSIFPTAIDTFTLVANSTYEFEGTYIVQTGTTSKTIALAFAISGASVTDINYITTSWNGTALAIATSQQTKRTNTVSSTVITQADTSAAQVITLRGIMRVTTGGTVVPQINFSAAPGGTNQTLVGSYLKFVRLDSDTNQTSGGWA